MRSILYKPQPGFGRFIAISLALHLSIFAAAVTIRADEKKSFYTPVYTVDLIAPPKAKEKPPVKIKKAATPVKKRPVKKRVEKKKPVKVKEKPAPPVEKVVEKVVKEPLKKTPVKVETVPETSDAIKKIREAVRKKDAAAAANVRIAALEKKAERGKAEVAALKKKLAEEADIKKALKEIRTLSAERRTAKKTPEKASIEKAPVEKAPTAPTSPAPSLVPQAALRADHKPYYDRVAEMIQKNWSYLEVPKDGYELLVSLKIDKKGKLMETWIEKGTPNRLFNDSLINAVKKAAPFPPLPATMEAEVFELGLRFCPRGCR